MNHRVLNLGAGTQSSVELIMHDRGDLPPVDVAIFADTMAEPKEVYDHLDWLKKQVKNTPIVTVCRGNLEIDGIEFRSRRFTEGEHGKRHASIPLFVLNPDGSQGIIRRQCTKEYKIIVIVEWIKRVLLRLQKGQRVPPDVKVQQLFGISFDERHRMRRSDDKWCEFEYPLVDLQLNRFDVIRKAERWFPDHTFPRSACVFCPYKSNTEWRRLRDEHPDDWNRAVVFDHGIRVDEIFNQQQQDAAKKNDKKLIGLPYVHRQMVPLDEADLRSDEDRGQLPMYTAEQYAALDALGQIPAGAVTMEDECSGMCGV